MQRPKLEGARLPEARQQIEQRDTQPFDAVKDHAEYQRDLTHHEQARSIERDGLFVERQHKINGRGVDNMDDQKEQGAEARDAVQQKAPLALAPAVAQASGESSRALSDF